MPHNSETHTVVLVNFHDAFDLRESPNSGVRYARGVPDPPVHNQTAPYRAATRRGAFPFEMNLRPPDADVQRHIDRRPVIRRFCRHHYLSHGTVTLLNAANWENVA